MLRPWLAVLALLVCALGAGGVWAWSVDFHMPAIVSGFAEAAERVRLEGLAMGLHVQAAEMLRDDVRGLRESGAGATELRAVRFALADRLRDAALLAEAEGNDDRAAEWLADAVQAAPERLDLLCVLTDLRTRDARPAERRLELLRLVHRHDAACANLLAGQSFLRGGDVDAARAYLTRAATAAPDWCEPHLAIARLELREQNLEAARARAGRAFETTDDLHARLMAAALLRQASGAAPERWRLMAEWAWREYAHMLPWLAAFAVLLVSPALVGLARRAVGWVRAQRGIEESAS